MADSDSTAPPHSHWATASIACSLFGILFFPGFLLAVVFAHMARRDERLRPEHEGAAVTTVALVVGYGGLALTALAWLALDRLFGGNI